MSDNQPVAIVDYGLGNLFSILRACEWAGISAKLSSDRREIEKASGVILPGVGAFGDAMATLQRLDLVSVLKDFAQSGKPLFGICLGLQLLMEESFEFGHHKGLGIVEGDVVKLPVSREKGHVSKVPQVCWNQVAPSQGQAWEGSFLAGVDPGEYFYFIHSFYVRPKNPAWSLSTTEYGQTRFSSSVQHGNVFACQFHPERSGPAGLAIYANFLKILKPN